MACADNLIDRCKKAPKAYLPNSADVPPCTDDALSESLVRSGKAADIARVTDAAHKLVTTVPHLVDGCAADNRERTSATLTPLPRHKIFEGTLKTRHPRKLTR